MIELWDPASGRHRATLRRHDDAVTSLVFTPNTGDLLSGSQDKTIRYWKSQPPGFPSIATLQVTGEGARCRFGIFSPDGKTVATTTYDWKKPQEPGEVKLWDSQNGKELAVLWADARGHMHARFSADGKLLVTGSGDRTLRIWEVESRRLRSTISTPRTVSCLALLPGGKWILTGHHGAAMSVWDIDSGRLMAEYVAASEESRTSGMSVQEVRYSPDGSLIAATGSKGAVVLWPTLPDESTAGETSANRVLGWSTEKLSLKGKP